MSNKFISALVVFFLCILSSNLFAKDVTLKEKIGQMILVGFKGSELADHDEIVKNITAQNVGGVILYEHNIRSPEQVKSLTNQLQHYAQAAASAQGKQFYPLFIGIDYEGGKVNRLKEKYGFPKTISAEEVGKLSLDEANEQAKRMAKTLRTAGINLNFAPVIDVNVNPLSPAIGKVQRSFSSDPQKVIEYAGVFSKAYQEQGIICSYKHFPGHGSASGDTHLGFVDVTQTWKEEELVPYQVLLKKPYSCQTVMTAHVVHYGLDSKGYPASISSVITKDLLREKLNFDGVVITDDLQMKAITNQFGLVDAIRLSINAGADILVFANQLATPQKSEELVNIIYNDVMTGKIRESRIDEAYQRIMKLKAQIRN